MEPSSELPDPAQSLTSLSLLLQNNLDRTIRRTLFRPQILRQILTLFSWSHSLSRFLIKYPGTIPEVFPVVKTTPEQLFQYLIELETEAMEECHKSWLRIAKTKVFIRIAISDFLELDSFEETTRKISLVADFCVRKAIEFSGLSEFPVSVVAMGKWGGMELNYSSDIDLLFIADNSLSPVGLYEVHNHAVKTVQLLDQVTEDGLVFRIDNRLRPEGATGTLVKTIRQYLKHYHNHALGWEFQALVKARYGGGVESITDEFIRETRPLVYNPSIMPETLLQQVREMKGKIEKALVVHHQNDANVKLGAGGIRDIEFIIQFLQLHHGRVNSNLHEVNTLRAIDRLRIHRIITVDEESVLRNEYIFLRQLEHYLQIENQLPVRQLPKDEELLNILGRKMNFSNTNARSTGSELLVHYQESIRRTRRIFHDFFDMTIAFLEKKERVRALCPNIPKSVLSPHFTRLESDYFLRFEVCDIAEHLRMASNLSNERVCELARKQISNDKWLVTIVAFDYIGEFAKICGLFSVYGLSIISGESFTYDLVSERTANRAKKDDTFYRRRAKRNIHRVDEPHKGASEERKIVCVAAVRSEFMSNGLTIPWDEFRDELEALLQLLRADKFQEASERINLRVVGSLTDKDKIGDEFRALPPIEFEIDNDSDNRYTILEIKSLDRFMFLFEFANVLATRNYYIGKVEISTVGNKVCDRLFITSKHGKKVVSTNALRNLTVTITLIKQFATFLPYAPNPQLALKQFGDFVDSVLDAKQQGVIPIIDQQNTLKTFARVLGTSSFLWEDFLRMQHQNLLPILMDSRKLNRSPSLAALTRRLRQHLSRYDNFADRVDCLNRFKDREMFRIDLRHLTRQVQRFSEFCRHLSDLADAVLIEAYRLAIEFAKTKYNRKAPGTSCICALGKWGGRELGYASDIELLFIWHTSTDQYHAAVEYYEVIAQKLMSIIKSRRDGIFELDFRLRPGGKNANLATPLNRYRSYFSESGEADPYERQALIRLRTVSGSRILRTAIEDHRVQYVFGSGTFDVERIKHLRQRQARELVEPGAINAKYSRGGLVDAEYFIQVLQIRSGAGNPASQATNTIDAAISLRDSGVISAETYERFSEGYRFLRALINGLRIVRGNARDLVIPPPESPEFQYLVRRLDNFEYRPTTGEPWEYICAQMRSVETLFAGIDETG